MKSPLVRRILEALDFDDPSDQHERMKYNRGISKYNRSRPQRFPCPTCKTPDALSAWEQQKGYQCNACADREEGVGW